MAKKSARKEARVRPSGDPQNVSEGVWYYESRRGIHVLSESHDALGNWIATGHAKIPWTRLAKSAARCGWTLKRAEKAQ